MMRAKTISQKGVCLLLRRTVGGIFFYLVRGIDNKEVKKLWPRPRRKPPATPNSPPARNPARKVDPHDPAVSETHQLFMHDMMICEMAL
jgi:hypothetical protein